MSLLKIYDSGKVEFEKDGYDEYCETVLWVDGNFIPAWLYESAYTFDSIFLQVLNTTKFENKLLTLVSSDAIGGYVAAKANGLVYADRQAEVLSTDTIYRLFINLDTGAGVLPYYSDIFKKLE